jgi:hypothetical protein
MIQGSAAKITTIVITSTILITTAGSPGGPDQALHANPAAAAANASVHAHRRISAAWRTVSRSPPASQANRDHPGGTSAASLKTASAHSRRSAGSTAIERRSSAAITRVNTSTVRPPPGDVVARIASRGSRQERLPGRERRWPQAPRPRWPVLAGSAGTGAAGACRVRRAAARPASALPLGHGRPGGPGWGKASPTSGQSAWPARTRAATATAPRTAPPAPTESGQKTQDAIPRWELYIGRERLSTSPAEPDPRSVSFPPPPDPMIEAVYLPM